LVPVPLHPRRLRWRGFNQSALLAEYVGKNLTTGFEIPNHPNLLQRKRYTPPQMKIKKYAQRIANLQQAFSLRKTAATDMPNSLQGKTILLVDDVATTGTTLFECAKVLKAGGAKKVFAVVIARQEIK
ncbi:MAG: phosphoribosyltransferase family protein, partial [Parcubacteria group bacterium]